jgi:hypothetical protein
MTDAERDKLDARFWELERIIQDIHAGKVVDGDPATLEGQCLQEQDRIEYLFGEDYFERREK